MDSSSNSTSTSDSTRSPRSKALRLGIVLGVPLVCALALRIPFIAGELDTPDSVRLARATTHFDPLEFAPHFPGYPVAVWLTRQLPEHAGSQSSGRAWSVLSALSGAIACAALAGVMRRRFGDGAALAAGVTTAVLPAFVIESLRVATDVAVLPWIVVGLGAASLPRGSLFGGFMVGLGLGIRPSAFVWSAGLLAASQRKYAAIGVTLGIALWLLPTLAIVGTTAYLEEGVRFTTAHFADWGGTAFTASGGSPTSRWSDAWHYWIAAPMGGFAVIAVVGLIALAHLAYRRAAFRPLAVGTAAYLTWIVVAQNPTHFRHAMPVAWIGVAVGTAAIIHAGTRSTLWRLGTTVGLGCLLTLSSYSSCSLAKRYALSTPPVVAAVGELASSDRFDPLLDRIYVHTARPFFSWLHPQWSVRTATTVTAVREDLAGLPLQPRRVWLSHAIEGVSQPAEIVHLRDVDLCEWGSRFALTPLDPHPSGTWAHVTSNSWVQPPQEGSKR